MRKSVENKTPVISFITSNKKKRLLTINGYIYHENKSTSKVCYWICTQKLCWAGVHLNPHDQFIKFTTVGHTHMPVPEQVEIRKLLTRVKARINDESTAIGQIYNEELVKANLTKSALAVAATARDANSKLNKSRRSRTPVLPTSIDFDIPSKYKITIDGERYLLADRVQRCGGGVEKRIIVFATDEQLRTLFDCSHIMMDGTFASSPSEFDQIYSIHGIKNDHSFVCAIALLGGRSTIIYKELFSILAHHANRLNMVFRPTKLTSDFELALIKTVADDLPNTRHIGCNFHFNNAIYRQVQHLGLASIYHDDESARSTIRKLMALSLIPIEQTEYGFKKITSEAPDSVKPLIKYFNGYWMSKVKWSLWNVGDVGMKTNNMVEGWNHRFNRLVAKFHPNIWHLFDCLKKEEVLVRQQILKMIMGKNKTKCKKSAQLQQQISSLRSRFEENQISLDELLEGLSLLIGTSK
ncbi:unnamed protein product [Adineta steineri]|uniref:MULE transposase domain-containing protein n=1 Tax=Adineta steineri TaxID=433720 RepID=A0A819HXN8_9BILA|nr:unnamed protein product [Adineta steineri]